MHDDAFTSTIHSFSNGSFNARIVQRIIKPFAFIQRIIKPVASGALFGPVLANL